MADFSLSPAGGRAIVIGGSISGLLAAAALRAVGWEVDVYERSAGELTARGGGLVLQGEVLRAFSFARLPSRQLPGVTTVDRIWLDGLDNVLQRSRMPQTQTSWGALYRLLKDAVPAGRIHAGAALVRYEQDAASVTAHFAGGHSVTADLLVGADGTRSQVRAQMLPGVVPAYAGYIAWRGLVLETELPAALRARLEGCFVFQQGADGPYGHSLLAYMVPDADGATTPGRRRWNWVWYRRVAAGTALRELLTDRDGIVHSGSLPPGALREEAAQVLRRDADRLAAPAFRAMIDATGAPFVQVITDLQAPRMRDGRVVLLGDAAAVVRPHTAGGTAKAAADAMALATALQRGSPTATLGGWERERLAAGREMGEWGIRLGDSLMGLEGNAA